MTGTTFVARVARFCIPFVFAWNSAFGIEPPVPVGPLAPHGTANGGTTREVLAKKRPSVGWGIPAKEKQAARAFWKAMEQAHPELASRRPAFEKAAAETRIDLWDTGPHAIEEGLYLLSLTPTGREMLKFFVPKWLKGTVTIEDMSSPEAKALSHTGDLVAQYRNGKLYWNPRGEWLTQIPALMHEAVHAVDLAGTPPGKDLQGWDEGKKKYRAKLAEANEAFARVEEAKGKAEQDERLAKAAKMEAEHDERLAKAAKAAAEQDEWLAKAAKSKAEYDERLAKAAKAKAEHDERLAKYLPIRNELIPLMALKFRRDNIRLLAESRAYQAQNLIVADLARQIPAYREGLRYLIERRKWIGDPIDEALFRQIMKDPVYDIPNDLVEKYLSKNKNPASR